MNDTTRPALLYLVHRIPYPPNKGDKIRSFNLLKHLAGRYRIHLGAFVDDPHDWRYQEDVTRLCESTCLLPLRPPLAKLASLRGFMDGRPLSEPYYDSRPMRQWVRRILDQGVGRVLVFSSAMAQYLRPEDHAGRRVVVDFVDVDSDKWRQYAASHRFPMNRIYARESRYLLDFERRVASLADAGAFVSEQEAALFRTLAPESAGRVHAIDNGVDVDYFSPAREYPRPYGVGEQHLVFTGAMDYWANVDAVCWFAREVFPLVRLEHGDARFTIVGARPAREVKQLEQIDGIQVTGAVKDVRPYLAHAEAAVAPLRIARGIQNKVLEAMAMGKPVLVTPQALDGLRACQGLEWPVSEDPVTLARMACDVLSGALSPEPGRLGRACVCEHYSWAEHMERFVTLLESP
ncbi:TIGR03087 family PEP-CTERM/XrtA system glycosyltransferase [Ectothiorhodospira lacustris]|uniref:TIGR03087 family PEP-CTERM/XrtA system glycosyltransferase n=1 Tax=Ectothiorhodospira lacustris TaxID=2899127 RepID=UPI001EE8A09D|nr:TIGR03087 family PEP-CTERM/XrtA system glycosyltransferase [Ectothiorhodospira lacustris]MCG5501056.1 TIGR03087 family PEP-CTERM/XrtA system glycosyltransferase [Ectothiorhodospira lacustris]